MKKTGIILLLIIVLGAGVYFLLQEDRGETGEVADVTPPAGDINPGDTEAEAEDATRTVIGKSVEGRDITAYHFMSQQAGGAIDTDLLFVGGIHGGYSWNTALVAYEMMDYLAANSAAIPQNVRVTVIPVVNPDGLSKVVSAAGKFSLADVTASQAVQVSGRFNARTVDLNRNFDCKWEPTGKWQTKTVSGGTAAFSEPETQAIRSYIEAEDPRAVVIWYSAAGGVFSSQCESGILPETSALNSVYAKASGYPSNETFDFYETSGDMGNWLAKSGIPAINVLLSTHTDVEWDKNRKGIEAILQHYAK